MAEDGVGRPGQGGDTDRLAQAGAHRPARVEQERPEELRRRREQLAEELSQMHWDLGGLAYEMAIRDHFRPDVLVRRAALMQERDMELAEVERKLRALGEGAERPQATPPVPVPAGTNGGKSRLASLRLPGLLLLAFLGFGVLVGHFTGPSSAGALAANGSPVKLVLGQAASAPSKAGGEASPPESEEEETPEPASPGSESSGASNKGTGKSSSSSSSQGGSEAAAGGPSQASTPAKLPAIEHVFVVMLSDEPYASAFGPASSAHYLAGKLEKQGALLVRYYAVAHEGLADEIALLSGQGPTEATAANCPLYAPIAQTSAGPHGQLLGQGCVYPKSTPTLMSQLAAKHLGWRAYVEGMGGACAHPAPGSADPSSSGTQAGGYQTARNPFVYFQSIAGSGSCASRDVGLSLLKRDLSNPKRTPAFSYIAPGPCDDGQPTACVAGKSAGMAAADKFLKLVVPEITGSKAYKENGLLVITVDQAPASGEFADSSSCCGQPAFPNLPAASGSAAGLGPGGGGQVGALLLSPFVKKQGTLVQDEYNHFSLLATIEQLFGLKRLGYAGLSEVKPLSPSVFSGSGE